MVLPGPLFVKLWTKFSDDDQWTYWIRVLRIKGTVKGVLNVNFIVFFSGGETNLVISSEIEAFEAPS